MKRRINIFTGALAAVSVALAGAVAPASAAEELPEAGLVVHYPLDETSGAIAKDASGNNKDASIVGAPALEGIQGVALDGKDDYVKLPDNIIAGLDSITVSMDVKIDPAQQGPYFIYGLGNPATSNSGTGYLFATGNAYRTTISPTNWQGEQNVDTGVNLNRGAWQTITYTLDHDSKTGIVYLNGQEVKRSTDITVTPGSLGGGKTTANRIGKSNYDADKLLQGNVRNFRIYDNALSASDVADLAPDAQYFVESDAAALNLGDLNAVTADLKLPVTGPSGTTITWATSNGAVIAANGAVTRPAAGAGNAVVELTATVKIADASATRKFTATVLPQETDAQAVASALAALEVINIDDVHGNLDLVDTQGTTTVTWATANATVISAAGVVNRPSAATTVQLTATITKGSESATKTFSAKVRAKHTVAELEGYAFAYFTGDTKAGENIFFAASEGNNALQWRELNNGEAVLKSNKGEEGLRDPFLIRSPEGDTFYLIATDLSIGGGTSWDASQRQGSQYVEIWESSDLVNWSEQRHVKVSPPEAGNTWAPEAYYDEEIGAYVLFWASKLYDKEDVNHTGNTYNRMMFATTRDFVNFSTPEVWQDQGMSRIDSTVIKEGNTFHRFTKDEGAGGTGCSDIIQEKSTSLRAQLDDWELVDSCIGKKAGTSAVEGPTIFKANPQDVNGQNFYLFVDEYGGRGYIPLASKTLEAPNWQVPGSYSLPKKPRHGTVIPVTKAELQFLTESLTEEIAPPVDPPANERGEILHYTFKDNAGNKVSDVSGNGMDGSIVGDAQWGTDSLKFDGANDYVKLPNNIMAGLDEITIEADIKIDPTLSGDYWLYGLGNTTDGIGDGYLFTSGNRNNYRSSITTTNWSGEHTASSGNKLDTDQWHKLTYTLADGVAKIYLNGQLVASKAGGDVTPGEIGNGVTTANYLGRSLYTADKLFKGEYREFAILNRALTTQEVLDQAGDQGALAEVTLTDPDVLKLDPVVDPKNRTVMFPVKPGTDLTKLAPTFLTAKSVTATPASGSVQDFTNPVTYTLNGSEGAQTTWTFSAQVVNNPALPGKYADPNIIAFGDTFYIYATSDGYPGWGGKEFYTWKSKDLVNWERADKPFLTLDGENGNVPWAVGNAWAPTIAEKDGKYYFYFSGHNPTYNRKTLGVAVADHPEGPFVAEQEPMILNNEQVTSGQAIDPAWFKDPASGKDYLLWGNGAPLIAELNDDMVSIKQETIKKMEGLKDYREGSFLNFRDGVYHLTYSIDDTGSPNYRVGYATATSIDGPWTYQGVVLEKDESQGILGTGHNSVLNVPGTDDWYMVYHRFAMPGGGGSDRETAIDKITFDPQTGLMNKVIPTHTGITGQTIVDQDPLAPTIAGEATVGATLTVAVNEPWQATGIEWLRDGQVIDGQTALTYVTTSADAGAKISARVTGEKPLWDAKTGQTTELGPIVDPAAPGDGDGPGDGSGDGSGNGTGNGSTNKPGDKNPSDTTTGTDSEDDLASTGFAGTAVGILAVMLLLAGAAAMFLVRRSRARF
ncbi:family 43 glycosylhydrolase [Jonesiaceae bacterium BS-20]|uniref:Family 43 glycosylhydrolase n=1 Tax=Jonesiaceae bacterium BS-20 TaxID=3120821 RepID=A0AAU7DW86_9MICO